VAKARSDRVSGANHAPAPGDKIVKGPDGHARRFTQLRNVLPQHWVEHARIELDSAHVETQIEAMNNDLYRLARHLKRPSPRRESGHLLIDLSGRRPVFDVVNTRWELQVEVVMRDGCRAQLLLGGDHHCHHAGTGARLACARTDRWLRDIRTEQRLHNSRPSRHAPSSAHPHDAIIGHRSSQACFLISHSDGAISEYLHDLGAWAAHARIQTLDELRRAVVAHNSAYHPDDRQADE